MLCLKRLVPGGDCVECRLCACFLGQDDIGGLGPQEWLRLVVVVVQVVADGLLQVGDAGESAAPDALAGDLGKEALDEVQSRCAGRREVAMEAGMFRQPRLHLGGLVRPVVVEHEVHVEGLLHGAVDAAQKP